MNDAAGDYIKNSYFSDDSMPELIDNIEFDANIPYHGIYCFDNVSGRR